MTTYLLIVCVILTAFLGLCFRAYLREQDTTKDYELLLEMDQTIIEKQRNNIDQLSLWLDGYALDMVGMVEMQLRDAATIRNMTASIEALSNEIDERNVAFAKLLLGGTVIEEGPLAGVRLIVEDEPIPYVLNEDES